jgi:allantoinase
VDPADLHHRHPVTPYAGRTLTGVVRRTWLRGQDAGAAPAGRLLTGYLAAQGPAFRPG